MKKRVRHHVNPLSLRHLDTSAQRVPLLPDLPVEVSLGCAEGEFLFARCAVAPRRQYIGVEIRSEHVRAINEQAAMQGLPQIRAVYANLLVDLPTLFAPGTVDLCHINFPDPFFKRAQHKRRFLTEPLARDLGTILRPGAILSYQSDVFELAMEALAALEMASPPFDNLYGPWSFAPDHDFSARTRRERFCREDGQRVWRARFRRLA